MKKFFLVLAALTVLLIGCDTGSEVIINNVAEDGFSLIESNLPINTNSSVSIMDFTGDGLGEMDTALYVPVRFTTLEDGTNDVVITFTFSEAIGSVFRISSNVNALTFSFNAVGPAEEGIFFNDSDSTGVTADSVTVLGDTVTFTFPAGSFNYDKDYVAAFGVTSDKSETYQVITTFRTYELVVDSPVIEALFLDENDEEVLAYAVDSEQVYFLHDAIEGDHIVEDIPADQFTGLSITALTTDFGGQINTCGTRFSATGTGDGESIFDNLEQLETASPIVQVTPNYVYAVTWPTYANTCTYNLYNGAGALIGTNADFTISNILDGTTVIGQTVSIDLSTFTIDAGTTFEAIPGNGYDDAYLTLAATDDIVDTVSPYMPALNLTTPATGAITWAGENYAAVGFEHQHNGAATEGHVVLFGTYDISSLTGYTIDEEDGLEFIISASTLAASAPTTQGAQKIITTAEVQEFIIEDGLAIPSDATFIASDSGTLLTTVVGSTIYVFSGFYCNYNDTSINYSIENWTATGTVTVNGTDLSGNELLYIDSDGIPHNNGNVVVSVE